MSNLLMSYVKIDHGDTGEDDHEYRHTVHLAEFRSFVLQSKLLFSDLAL